MNERYLFKAKRIDNGEWVEGYYAVTRDKKGLQQHNILVADNDLGYFKWIVVDPSTICQCTALKDKNGKLIWENDIVRVKHTDGQEIYQEHAKVSYTKRGFSPFSWEYYCDGCDLRCEILEIEVICSIFDNPELLEV